MILRRMRCARWLAALGLSCAPLAAWAAPPIGHFEIPLGGSLSVWLPGDRAEEAFCEEIADEMGELEHCDFEIVADGRGRLSGRLDLAGWDDGVRIALRGPLRGWQRGEPRTGSLRASFLLKLSGEAFDGSVALGVRASFRYAAEIAPGGVVSGFWDRRICVRGAGCTSDRSALPMTTATNGGWRIELEIDDAPGGALYGGARVVFGDGSECLYAIRGKHDALTGQSRLALSAITSHCAGSWLRLRLTSLGRPVLAAPVALKYELFGHRGDVVLIPYPRYPLFVPIGSPGGNPPTNQDLFAFICEGTLTITAATDPATCTWSIFAGSPSPTGASVPATSVAAEISVPAQRFALEILSSD